eukprot:786031-Pleurochrysis_carterae.AAC.3
MRCSGRVAGGSIVPWIVFVSWRSTFASVSGDMAKSFFSSVVRAQIAETGCRPMGGAAVRAVPPGAPSAAAGIGRVVGPAAAAGDDCGNHRDRSHRRGRVHRVI